MTIEKINGKYIKKRLTPESKVPLLLWLSIVLILACGVIFIGLKTSQIIDGPQPELTLARKHSYKIIAVGDIACSADEANFNDGKGLVDACHQKAVGKAIENEHADAVMLLGDIQYPTGLVTDYNRSFVPYWRGITIPIYSVPGNHDYGNATRTPSLDGYKQTFKTFFPSATYEKEGKGYYDFNIAEWQFYALDSNCDYVGGCGDGSDQLNWLTRKVTSSTAKCSIAMWHHPVFTSGEHNALPDITYGRDFWRTLQDAGTDIVLNGHDHDYERFIGQTADGVASDKGIREFVSGTGGYSLRAINEPYTANSEKRIDDQFGYLELELFPGHYTWQFKDVGGGVLDTGSGSCH
jgi:predicted phosphodiesterase